MRGSVASPRPRAHFVARLPSKTYYLVGQAALHKNALLPAMERIEEALNFGQTRKMTSLGFPGAGLGCCHGSPPSVTRAARRRACIVRRAAAREIFPLMAFVATKFPRKILFNLER